MKNLITILTMTLSMLMAPMALASKTKVDNVAASQFLNPKQEGQAFCDELVKGAIAAERAEKALALKVKAAK